MSLFAIFIGWWVLFEAAQIVACERFLHVEGDGDLANEWRRDELGERVAFVWSVALIFYYAWMVVMFFREGTRVEFGVLLLVSILGFGARRMAAGRHVLALLALEGAIRTGVLLVLLGSVES